MKERAALIGPDLKDVPRCAGPVDVEQRLELAGVLQPRYGAVKQRHDRPSLASASRDRRAPTRARTLAALPRHRGASSIQSRANASAPTTECRLSGPSAASTGCNRATRSRRPAPTTDDAD